MPSLDDDVARTVISCKGMKSDMLLTRMVIRSLLLSASLALAFASAEVVSGFMREPSWSIKGLVFVHR